MHTSTRTGSYPKGSLFSTTYGPKTLRVGMQSQPDDIFKDKRTYRATAAYVHQPTGTRLHGSYGTGSKNPTLSELYGSTPTYTGNPNLTPETSRGWDFGVEQGFLEDRVVADVTYFNNRITDLITNVVKSPALGDGH